MRGYTDGYDNKEARPITREFMTMLCSDCGVPQTHHTKGGTTWRCVICEHTTDHSEAME